MNRPPTAIILAAGYGKRLRPLTWFTPKPLIKVNGISVIDYVIAGLNRAGINEIYANVHYRPIQMLSHLSFKGVSTIYERTLLGTAGTIKLMIPFMSDDFVVCNADTITTLDIGKIYNYHIKFKNLATFAWLNGKCTGTMVFNKEVSKFLPQRGMIDDVFSEVKFSKYYSDENRYWDIGTFEKLAKARREVK